MVARLRAVAEDHPRIRDATGTLVVAVGVVLLTGIVPNQPAVYTVGARYYGYPLYWRIQMPAMGRHSLAVTNLLVDVLVYWVGGAIALPVARRARDYVDERTG